MLSSKSSFVAPSAITIDFIKTKPTNVIKIPKAIETYTIKEKILFGLSLSPSPIVLEINALPPSPNIKPIETKH